MIYENTPRLETERLILRKLEETPDDLNAMFAILSDREANTFLPWYPAENLDDVRRHVRERYFDQYAAPAGYRYVICLKSDNIPVGYVGMSNDDSRDFGYGLRSGFQHRGIATEAARAVTERIRAAGYSYITATHDVNNPRSGEVMPRQGMRNRNTYKQQWHHKKIHVTFRMNQ